MYKFQKLGFLISIIFIIYSCQKQDNNPPPFLHSIRSNSIKNNSENQLNLQIDSLLILSEFQLKNNENLEALQTSSKFDSLSKKILIEFPEKRLIVISKRIELLYNYSLEETMLDEVDDLLLEATNILFKNQNLIPLAKVIYYWKGVTAYGKREYETGVNHLQIAINIAQNQAKEVDTAFLILCQSKIAFLYKGAKKLEKSKHHFEKALFLGKNLSLFQKEKQIAIGDLVAYYIEIKDSLNTFNYINLLASIPKDKRFVSTEHLKGIWFFKRNNFKKSIQAFKKLEITLDKKQLLFQRHKLYSECSWVLSKMYLKEKKFELAIHYLSKYLFVDKIDNLEQVFTWKELASHKDYFQASSRSFMLYGLLAENILLMAEEEKDERLRGSLLSTAIGILEQTDSMMFSYSLMDNEESAIKLIQEVCLRYYPIAINICYLQYQKNKETQYLDKANFFMERLKAFSLTKDIHKTQLSAKEQSPLLNKLKKIEKEERKIGLTKKNQIDLENRINLSFLNAQRRILIDSIQQYHPLFFKNLMQQNFQPQASLYNYFKSPNTKGTAFLQYNLTENFLFLIYNDAANKIFQRIKLPDSFPTQLENYRSQLAIYRFGKKKALMLREISNKLFHTLIGDKISRLCEQNKQLIIIPDKYLYQIPFEALRENDQYWIEKMNIAYAFSLKTILNSNSPSISIKSDSKILAFSFSNKKRDKNKKLAIKRGDDFSELHGAAKEVTFLTKVFNNPNNTFFFGQNCKKESFLQEIEKDYPIVHLALHTETNSTGKHLHNLIFKKPNNQFSRLTEPEIENLTLKNPLVILSACSTNQGKEVLGEGIYSIARAFKKAGAQIVITTLWAIDDEFTNQIIQIFYRKLLEGYPPSIALSMAKIEYLKKADNLTNHPSLWAGITCYS